jgi:hypothetical protein
MDKEVALVGVSTVAQDEEASYFELRASRYWRTNDQGQTMIGVGGLGGSIAKHEDPLDCLRQLVERETGARIKLDVPEQTYLFDDWALVGTLDIPPGPKRPKPLMIVLTPPQLGGPGMPDHLAIVVFRTTLQDAPQPQDIFGMLRVEHAARSAFFARDQWPMPEIEAHAGLQILSGGELPAEAILYPTLAARAFQDLVRHGHL